MARADKINKLLSRIAYIFFLSLNGESLGKKNLEKQKSFENGGGNCLPLLENIENHMRWLPNEECANILRNNPEWKEFCSQNPSGSSKEGKLARSFHQKLLKVKSIPEKFAWIIGRKSAEKKPPKSTLEGKPRVGTKTKSEEVVTNLNWPPLHKRQILLNDATAHWKAIKEKVKSLIERFGPEQNATSASCSEIVESEDPSYEADSWIMLDSLVCLYNDKINEANGEERDFLDQLRGILKGKVDTLLLGENPFVEAPDQDQEQNPEDEWQFVEASDPAEENNVPDGARKEIEEPRHQKGTFFDAMRNSIFRKKGGKPSSEVPALALAPSNTKKNSFWSKQGVDENPEKMMDYYHKL